MEFKKPTSKTIKVIGLIIAVIIIIWITSSFWSDFGLKSDIRDRESRIEKIDDSKKPILEAINSDNAEIKRKDSIILALSNKEKALLRTVKHLRNENNRIKSTYTNSSIDERVRIFAELATEKDTVQ